MGLRFRKSIKLGDLVKLNVSKSGLSASIGRSGASINIGNKGAYLNVSPTLAGVKGTGVSYRKKIISNPFKINKKDKGNEKIRNNKKEYNDLVDIHKCSDSVLNKKEFDSLNNVDNIDLLIKGDETIIEERIGYFLDNINLDYPVKANYELEDKILFVDLDLPEIELLSLNNIKLSKEEYAKLIINLGLYLSINFFNVSSYIDEIIMSPFISKRNKDGDLVDEYLYSVKYKRDIFEKTNFKNLDNTYDYLLQFENRINMNTSFTFKGIKPFSLAALNSDNSQKEDAVLALEALGYKARDIKDIMPKLEKMELKSSSDYIKEALKLLKK